MISASIVFRVFGLTWPFLLSKRTSSGILDARSGVSGPENNLSKSGKSSDTETRRSYRSHDHLRHRSINGESPVSKSDLIGFAKVTWFAEQLNILSYVTASLCHGNNMIEVQV